MSYFSFAVLKIPVKVVSQTRVQDFFKWVGRLLKYFIEYNIIYNI